MTTLEDAELLRRYTVDRSEAAFAELVERHLTPVYSFALRQVGGDAHLAKDIVQLVFTALARKAGQLTDRQVLGGWLCRTTHFAARDVVRAERRRRTREREAHTMDESSPAADANPDWEKLHPMLDQTMGELREADRDAVWLRFFEGRSFAEVGAKLQLSENAARMRVERALDKLHDALARRGVTSTAAALSATLANQASVAAPAGLASTVTGVALAGATGVGGTLGVLAFMSTGKLVSGIVGVVGLLAIGTAIYQTKALRDSTAVASAMMAQRDDLEARLAAAEKRAQHSEAALSTAQSGLAELNKRVEHPSSPRPSARTTDTVDYVLDHPELRSAYLADATLSLKTRFDKFFRTAGITGEQQDRFLKVAMDDAEARLDALAAKRAAGWLNLNGAPVDQAAIERIGAQQQQREAALAQNLQTLLGDQYQPAMQYLGTNSERNVADRLASLLYYTDAPLTASQADQLIQVFAQNSYRAQANPSPLNTMGGTFIPRELVLGTMAQSQNQAMPWLHDAPVTDAAVAGAASVLTPAQLSTLKVLQAQQAAELQLVPPRKGKA